MGEGAFAKAYKGLWKDTPVAVKQLNINGQTIIPRNIFQELRKEASVMRYSAPFLSKEGQRGKSCQL